MVLVRAPSNHILTRLDSMVSTMGYQSANKQLDFIKLPITIRAVQQVTLSTTINIINGTSLRSKRNSLTIPGDRLHGPSKLPKPTDATCRPQTP